MNATLIASRPEGPSGRLLSVEVPAVRVAAHRAAGQYCAVEHDGQTGYFALASLPGRRPFEFYVQAGGGSSDGLLTALAGTRLQVGSPQGEGFGVERVLSDDAPVYILATGSGLSGVRSSVQLLAERGRGARLYVGARTAADLLFRADYPAWQDAGVAIEPVFSRDPAGAGRAGYVQAALLADVPDLRGAWVFACGQPEMQAESRDLALAAGLAPDRFLTNH